MRLGTNCFDDFCKYLKEIQPTVTTTDHYVEVSYGFIEWTTPDIDQLASIYQRAYDDCLGGVRKF